MDQYALVQKLAKKFEEQNDSIIYRELLGLDHQKDGPCHRQEPKRIIKPAPCAELVRSAAKLIEEYMEEQKS